MDEEKVIAKVAVALDTYRKTTQNVDPVIQEPVLLVKLNFC